MLEAESWLTWLTGRDWGREGTESSTSSGENAWRGNVKCCNCYKLLLTLELVITLTSGSLLAVLLAHLAR